MVTSKTRRPFRWKGKRKKWLIGWAREFSTRPDLPNEPPKRFRMLVVVVDFGAPERPKSLRLPLWARRRKKWSVFGAYVELKKQPRRKQRLWANGNVDLMA